MAALGGGGCGHLTDSDVAWVGRQGLRSIAQGPGFRIQGSGFRVQDSRFRVQGSGFRVQSNGVRGGVKGKWVVLGFWGSGFRVY